MRRSLVSLSVLGLGLVLSVGCDRGERREVKLAPFSPAVSATFEARVSRVMARPEIDHAMDALLDRITGDPALAALGGRMLDTLGSDPAIAANLEAITGSISQSPEVQRQVRAMMAAHPEMTAADIGAAFGAKVGKAFEQNVGPTIEAGVGRLLHRIDVGAEVEALKAHFLSRFGAAIDGYFDDPARNRAWGDRLIKLNHGRFPTPDEATGLYLDTAWSEERMTKFLVVLLSDPVFEHEVTEVLRKSLENDAIERQVRATLGGWAADDELRDHATRAMMLLMAEHVDAPAAQRELDAILDSPQVTAGTTALCKEFLGAPATAGMIDDAITHVMQSPGIRKATTDLLERW